MAREEPRKTRLLLSSAARKHTRTFFGKALFPLVRALFRVLLLVAAAPRDAVVSQQADNGSAVTGNGDGPLVGREPSAEDTTTRQEQLMSEPERTGGDRPSEALRQRWRRRLQRLRYEAGLYLVRGAATAVGGTLVTYTAFWIQARV